MLRAKHLLKNVHHLHVKLLGRGPLPFDTWKLQQRIRWVGESSSARSKIAPRRWMSFTLDVNGARGLRPGRNNFKAQILCLSRFFVSIIIVQRSTPSGPLEQLGSPPTSISAIYPGPLIAGAPLALAGGPANVSGDTSTCSAADGDLHETLRSTRNSHAPRA